MKNILLVVALVAVVAVGGFFMINKPKQEEKKDVMSAGTQTELPTVEDGSTGASGEVMEKVIEASSTEGEAMEKGTVKEFAVSGKPFSFTPSEIKVKKGDTVKIVFTNEAGMHDWVIDEFNARTKQIQAGQSETISFVADKAGTFEYYCSVGNHRQQGMKGNLVVE